MAFPALRGGSLSATPCAKQNAGPERNFLILRELRTSGGRTRTYDLRVMSPTSYQLLYPASVYHEVISRWPPVKRETGHSALVNRRLAGEMVARVQRRSGLRGREIPGGFRGDTPRLCSVSRRHTPNLLCFGAVRYWSGRVLASARLLADSGAARPGSAPSSLSPSIP